MAVNYKTSDVRPLIPDAQRNLAPEIITRGLAAMAQMTVAREKMQLEAEQMATDAALKSRGLEIARENNKLDYEVGMKNAEAYETYRNTQAAFEGDSRPGSKAWRMNKAAEKEQDFADFTQELDAGGLFATRPENPVEFYKNAQEAKRHWRLSSDTRIHSVLKGLDKTMEDYHTVSIRRGWDKNLTTGKFEAAGPLEKVPVGRIIEELNDPLQVDATMQLLERNGLVTSTTVDVKVPGKKPEWLTNWIKGKDFISRGIGEVVGAVVPSSSYPSTTKTLNPSFGKFMKMGEGMDFSRGKPRQLTAETASDTDLPAGVTDVDAAGAASEDAPLPAPEALFTPTETQQIIARAKAAIAAGKDRTAVIQLLESKGIDPALLDK